MPRNRRHRCKSKSSSGSGSSGTVVPPSSRAPSSARSHRFSSTRHSKSTTSSRRPSHLSSASRPPSSSKFRPSTYSSSRSSMVSGTSSSRHPSSSHSSSHRSSAGRSSSMASESLSSQYSQAQSSSSGTDISSSSYHSSSESGTSHASSSHRSGSFDKTVGPWDSVSRSGTPPPSSQGQFSRARNRAAYVETDEPGFRSCFCLPSSDLEYYNSLARARGHQIEKRDYVAELSEQFIKAPADRLEFILDKLATQLADLVQLQLYITSLERYRKRNNRKDIWGEMNRILARYERAMNTPQLFQVMGDIAFE